MQRGIDSEVLLAVAARTDLAFQQCIDPACAATFAVDEVLTCTAL